jgi:hypothetical protein
MINVQTAKTAELVAFYNANAAAAQTDKAGSSSFRPIKKFADRATAEKRVAELLKALKPKASKKAAKKEVGNADHRARKIHVLVKGNPKFGTAAVRYALYKNGMTVGEYVALGGQVRDVCWDVKQGWIELR